MVKLNYEFKVKKSIGSGSAPPPTLPIWREEYFIVDEDILLVRFITLRVTPLNNSMQVALNGMILTEGLDYDVIGSRISFISGVPLELDYIINLHYQIM